MKKFHQLNCLFAWFCEYMVSKNFRPRTITDYNFELSSWFKWLDENREIEDVDDISKEILNSYSYSLYAKKLAVTTIVHKLSVLKSFFKTIYKENRYYRDLSVGITLPRVGQKLPTAILTEKEVIKIFNYLEQETADKKESLNIKDALHLRNCALFEILYSTGIRNGEIINLKLVNVNYHDEIIEIRNGKGGKDRVVPIGEKSLSAVHRYVTLARPLLLNANGSDYLFISCRGKKFSIMVTKNIIDEIIKKADITRKITVHGIRHSSATHMLNRGADIRYVQEFLGHSSLNTTQIYTRVSINRLKKVHRKHHPREQENFYL